MNKLILFLLIPTLVFSQIDMSVGINDGYFSTNDFGEFVMEGRYSIPLKKENIYFTPSVVFVTDGTNYQTFPRIGFTKFILTRKNNWSRLTLGVQAYDLEINGLSGNRQTTSIFSDETWKTRPFIKFHTPMFKLFNDCRCGGQYNKLLMELIIDISTDIFGIGIGVRRRI
jgi:hypothetical protein